MYLYNSVTHKKEEFRTHTPGHVEMYTCGPTVYHFAHIGNLRSYIMEDVLEKYLRYVGYDVNRVMNITDVGHLTSDADEGEDKMLKGARREHKTVMEIAQFYTDAFFEDCRKLNIKRPDVVQPATGLIDDYIRIISRLLEKGYAYVAGGNVYFDTSKLERYYVFNDHNEEDLAVGVREGVEEDVNKRNKNDFVLWFTKSKFEDQALKWDSPWGVGYPGWHIECSGISMKYNGEYLDLHCGGVDNAFPHHTNEIAQSGELSGPPLVPPVVPCGPPQHQQRQDEQVQGRVPDGVPAGGEGLCAGGIPVLLPPEPLPQESGVQLGESGQRRRGLWQAHRQDRRPAGGGRCGGYGGGRDFAAEVPHGHGQRPEHLHGGDGAV